MAKALFVTGTDTEVGKTFVTCVLLAAAQARGLRTMGLKPVAAGALSTNDGLRNEDALALQKNANVPLSYDQVNPIVLEEAIAPHLAAQHAGRQLSLERLAGLMRGALMQRHDLALIEGAGGWMVPLNNRQLLSDLAVELALPVILVVGMRLGCINHALLTCEAIQRRGLKLAGWVANQLTDAPMAYLAENVQTLKSAIDAPCLGVVPYQQAAVPGKLISHLNIDVLLGSDQ